MVDEVDGRGGIVCGAWSCYSTHRSAADAMAAVVAAVARVVVAVVAVAATVAARAGVCVGTALVVVVPFWFLFD